MYTIKPEVGVGNAKRVHRNNIMGCNMLLGKNTEVSKESVKKKTKSKKKVTAKTTQERRNSTEESTSDEEIAVIARQQFFGGREEIPDGVEGIVDLRTEDDVLEKSVIAVDSDECEAEDEDSTAEVEPPPVEKSPPRQRRSRRNIVAPTILTYDTIGGNPAIRPR